MKHGVLCWQGEDGTPEVAANLAKVASILHESFDPIIDLTTGQDLLPVMVYAQELGAWDYTGMYSAVLQHQVATLPTQQPVESLDSASCE